MSKNDKKNGINGADVAVAVTPAKKKGRPAKKKNDVIPTFDIDLILTKKKVTKSALSFNQDKKIADKLTELSLEKEEKTSSILNMLLASAVDVEKGICIVDIAEIKQDKVQNTYKIDTDVLDVLKSEAKSRNMSTNDYLNKVLEVVLNLKIEGEKI